MSSSNSLVQSRIRRAALLLWIGLTVGCVTSTTKNGKPIPNPPSAMSQRWDRVKSSTSNLIEKVTPKDSSEPIAWKWKTGLPQSVTKCESISPLIPIDAVAAFAPDAKVDMVRLASTGPAPTVPISVINETRIRSFGDFLQGIQSAIDQPKKEWPTIPKT
jgi:hypothetical protein